MKRRILFYSDCSFFAGCENMLSLFSNSEELRSKYDVFIAFRQSDLYKQGLDNKTSFSRNEKIPCTIYRGIIPAVSNSFLFKILTYTLTPFLREILFFANIARTFKIVKKINPDIVHINNGGFPGALGCNSMVLGARLAGVKNIIYIINNIAVPYRSITRVLDFLKDKIIMRFVTLFVTGSYNAKKHFEHVLNIPSRRVVNFANGIKPGLTTNDRDALRNSFGIGNDELVIGIVAILEWRKGHHFLVEAFIKAVDENLIPENTVLLIEGEGPEKQNLKHIISEAKLENRIRFVGSIKYVFDFYTAIDIFAFSSIAYEDFPNVIIEAMSMSLPIIATKIAGVPEQITNNENGILVNIQDVESMKNAIQEIVNNRTLRDSLSREAYKRYCNSFSIDIALKRYINLYDSLYI